MTYGKNQLALLKFLEKYPNRWHKINRRKAIDSAVSLNKRGNVEMYRTQYGYIGVLLRMPQMLIKQN